jgi:hypothetical protein
MPHVFWVHQTAVDRKGGPLGKPLGAAKPLLPRSTTELNLVAAASSGASALAQAKTVGAVGADAGSLLSAGSFAPAGPLVPAGPLPGAARGPLSLLAAAAPGGATAPVVPAFPVFGGGKVPVGLAGAAPVAAPLAPPSPFGGSVVAAIAKAPPTEAELLMRLYAVLRQHTPTADPAKVDKFVNKYVLGGSMRVIVCALFNIDRLPHAFRAKIDPAGAVFGLQKLVYNTVLKYEKTGTIMRALSFGFAV